MKLLLTAIVLVSGNVAIPYGAWGYGAGVFSIGEREFFRRYKVFSVPRLAIGGLSCILMEAGSLFPREEALFGILAIVVSVLFVVVALYDTYKIEPDALIRGKPRGQG